MVIVKMIVHRGFILPKYWKFYLPFHNFSGSSSNYNVWRLKQNLEANPNNYGPLKNLPDFSFVDGRPVPLSLTKQRDLERQKQYCKEIMELSKEIDDGLELYYKKKIQKEEERQNILKNKLKPKGALLIKNINSENN